MGYVLASFIVFIVAQVKILVTLGADVPFTLSLAMSLVGLFGALSRNIESLQVMYRVTTSRELKVWAHRNTYDRYSQTSRAYFTWIQIMRRENLTSDCPTEKSSFPSMASHAYLQSHLRKHQATPHKITRDLNGSYLVVRTTLLLILEG